MLAATIFLLSSATLTLVHCRPRAASRSVCSGLTNPKEFYSGGGKCTAGLSADMSCSQMAFMMECFQELVTGCSNRDLKKLGVLSIYRELKQEYDDSRDYCGFNRT